jgi:hypothetical protein
MLKIYQCADSEEYRIVSHSFEGVEIQPQIDSSWYNY